MQIKKLIMASAGTAGADIGVRVHKLYWFKCKLSGQLLDCVLDSAATQCCIAKRCVSSSPILRNLPLKLYCGEPLLDANRRPLTATHVISIEFQVGKPLLSLQVDVVVVDHLPYSCIVGTTFLSRLESWGVNNTSSTLHLNSSSLPVYDAPHHDAHVTLITCGKTTLAPGESKFVKAISRGPGMSAYRPVTEDVWMYEGVPEQEERSRIRVSPSLNVLGTRNNHVIDVRVTNTSAQRRCVGKGIKLAYGHKDFDEVCEEGVSNSEVNSIGGRDVVDILCNRNKFEHLSETEYNQMRSLVTEFKDIFTISSETIGRANNSSFDIDTDNMEPVAIPLRRIPLHKQQIVKQLIDRYKELGLIEEIDSPFRAAMVLVEKKNVGGDITDRYRLCVDYRVLNEQLPDSAWPAPSVEHCLDSAAGSVFFSKLDFNNGYHQIPCTPAAKRALAFSPGIGFSQLTFNRMPQGAKSSASVFQKSMEKTFSGLEECILPPYYDDLNVKSRTFTQHLKNARLVFTRIRDCGYTLNALKCFLFQTKVKYLGHVVENGSISLDPDRVSAIVNIPVPNDIKSLRSFIGMAQFCSRFIPHLNDLMSPLSNLLKKNTPFVWDDKCQTAFDQVKQSLMNPPILRAPSPDDTFILETDASDHGIGGCLKISSASTGEEAIVGFHSGKFKDQELRWHIVEKEAYAILDNLSKFKHFLIGKRFTLKTDNRVLTYVKTSKSKKLANWALQMLDFDFDIVHIPSKDNRISDFFSRLYDHINIISVLDPIFNNQELSTAQHSDQFMNNAFLYVRSKRDFDVEKLGPLKRYRKFLTIDEHNVLRWKSKIVLPSQFRSQILEAAHDHPAAGHFAEDRTWKNVTDKFFWPGAHDDVVNWVRSCETCNQFDVKRYVSRPLEPISTTGRFELVSYDIAGPFIPSKLWGNTYALIIVDHFTKWPELVPLKDIKAHSLATVIFEQWCCRYGVMAQLHSDGANNVHGELMKELCKHIGTVKSKSSWLHPQGDGMAEAVVKLLKNAIRKQVDIHGRDWDQFVQATAFALRTSINQGTNCTPAELVLGGNLVRPIDVSAPLEGRTTFPQRQAREFAANLSNKIDQATEIVQSNLLRSRRKMKAAYDQKTSHHEFSVGDSVMLWWPYYKKGVPRSFQPKWRGPYVIKDLIGNTNCSIIMKDGSIKHVHLNQLKPATLRQVPGPSLPNPANTSDPVPTCDIFDDLYDVPDESESEYESAVESIDGEEGFGRDVSDLWCGLNERNVIGSRTRSGLGGGGG